MASATNISERFSSNSYSKRNIHSADKFYLTNYLFHTLEKKISQNIGLRTFLENFNSPWLQRSSGSQDVVVVPE